MFQQIAEKLFDLILYIFVRQVEVDEKAIFKELERREVEAYNERQPQNPLYKTREFITDDIVVETFDSDENFIRAVSPYDMYIGKSKEDILKQIANMDKQSRIYMLYMDYFKRIEQKLDEVSNCIESVGEVKWIRVYFKNILNFIETHKQYNLQKY